MEWENTSFLGIEMIKTTLQHKQCLKQTNPFIYLLYIERFADDEPSGTQTGGSHLNLPVFVSHFSFAIL